MASRSTAEVCPATAVKQKSATSVAWVNTKVRPGQSARFTTDCVGEREWRLLAQSPGARGWIERFVNVPGGYVTVKLMLVIGSVESSTIGRQPSCPACNTSVPKLASTNSVTITWNF